MWNTIKNSSLQYKLVAGFMILQYVFLWIVQCLPDGNHRGMVQETYLSIFEIVVLTIFLFGVAKKKIVLKKPTAMQTVLVIMAILCALSTAFGLNPTISLTGRIFRYEGLYSLYCYYVLCGLTALITSKNERKLLIYEFMIIGVVCSVVGIASGMSLIYVKNSNWNNIASVPFINPNFYASMMTMVSAVSFAMFLYTEEKKEKVWSGITLLLAFLAIFSCDSSSPFVGNIMMFLIVLFSETVVRLRKKDKARFRMILAKMAVCLLMWFVAALAINTLRNGSVTKELERDAYYADEGLISDKMFSNRMGVWKFIISQLPEHWALGVGPENLWLITYEYGEDAGVQYFDRAHNEYLHIAITQGVPALIAYLVLLFMIFIPAMKRWLNSTGKMPIYILSFMAFFAYIAQAFFNISVIQVAPYFWIICGLCEAGRIEEQNNDLVLASATAVGSSNDVEIEF